MRIRFVLACLSALALVAVAACEGEKPSLEQAATAAKQAVQQVEHVAEQAGEKMEGMDTEHVSELAGLVVALEKAPEKAAELLEAHGMTRAQLDAALQKISESPELQKLFDTAKQAAVAAESH